MFYRNRYDFNNGIRLEKFQGTANGKGYLTVDELHEICYWKSKRRAELAKGNSESLVEELTRLSFATNQEEAKLGALTLLSGVKIPMASVILHFCADQSYPILDVRALWSLTIEKPAQYDFNFWEGYTKICRDLAEQYKMTVRDLDMALWQFSKEKQK